MNGLQVIAHYAGSGNPAARSVHCRGFYNIPIMEPCLVRFLGISASDESLSERLGEKFCQRLLAFAGVTEAAGQMPCCGLIPGSFDCHAADDADCKKLLVLVGNGSFPRGGCSLTDLPPEAQAWISEMGTDPQWDVLPVLPSGAPVNDCLPRELHHKNVSFWQADLEGEVLPGVFQRSGLAPEDYRIFISYIRRETTELAEQLHDALTREGFAVFVDRFSVPDGVDFQQRLMQELIDRGMVLLLHSPGLGSSQWVEDEIATATMYRLGLYVLRLPGVSERATLAPDRSRPIDAGEWDTTERKLTASALDSIVHEIKRVHHEAHERQLHRLANSLAASLSDPAKGNHGCSLEPVTGRLFVVSHPSRSEVPLLLTARPAELKDFHEAHVIGNVASRGKGGIIAPAPLLVSQRRDWFTWLGGIANLKLTDEGQLNNTVDEIITGNF